MRVSAPARPPALSCQRPQPTGLTASAARRPPPPSCTSASFLFSPPAAGPDTTSATDTARPLSRCGSPRSLGLVPPPPGTASRESTEARGGQTSAPAGTAETRLRRTDWSEPKNVVTSPPEIGATRCGERRSPGRAALSRAAQRTDKKGELEAGSLLKLRNRRSAIAERGPSALGQWRNG